VASHVNSDWILEEKLRYGKNEETEQKRKCQHMSVGYYNPVLSALTKG